MTMPDGSLKIAHYALPIMEAIHLQCVQYGLCFLRGGSRDVDSMRLEVVAIDKASPIIGATKDDPAGKRVVTTNYIERDYEVRRSWTQLEIDAARLLHNIVISLPIQRSLVLQCFYANEFAEIWETLLPSRQAGIIHDLTNWPARPRGVNAGIDAHNQQYGDCVPHIVPELFMTIKHRAIRELLARLRGLPP